VALLKDHKQTGGGEEVAGEWLRSVGTWGLIYIEKERFAANQKFTAKSPRRFGIRQECWREGKECL